MLVVCYVCTQTNVECKMHDQKLSQICEYFNNGYFPKCLNELNKYETKSFLNSVLLANNNIVCEALVRLCSKANVDDIDFINYYENVLSIDSMDRLPLEILLLCEFNFLWWRLITSQYYKENQNDLILATTIWGIVKKTFKRVLGFDPCLLNTKNETSAMCNNLLKVLTYLINNNPKAAAIYLESITVILTLTLLESFEKNSLITTEIIGNCLLSIFNYKTEILAIENNKTVDRSNHNENDLIFYFKFGFKRYNSNFFEIDSQDTFDVLLLLREHCAHGGECILDNRPKYSLWAYSRARRLIKTKEFSTSLGILLNGVSKCEDAFLRDKYHLLLAYNYSQLGEYTKALEYLNPMICDTSPPYLYFLLGFVHGRMGLLDPMVHNFEILLQVVNKAKKSKYIIKSMSDAILYLLHPTDEITKPEALYLLATAYAFHERFEDASKFYDKLLSPKYTSDLVNLKLRNNQILEIPQLTSILNDAAVTKLLLGDSENAEILCLQAIQAYTKREITSIDSCGAQDLHWIQQMIQTDLNITPIIEQSVALQQMYSTEDISEFSVDIIGLLIHAELLKVQSSTTECKNVLTESLLHVSKFISQRQNESSLTDGERKTLMVVKALTSRTCLNIALLHSESTKPFAEVDRMFRRALFCNKGNKDVFYHYAHYLKKEGKEEDAVKLWKTFATCDSIININQCQSVSLRYLLRTQISRRQLNELKLSLKL